MSSASSGTGSSLDNLTGLLEYEEGAKNKKRPLPNDDEDEEVDVEEDSSEDEYKPSSSPLGITTTTSNNNYKPAPSTSALYNSPTKRRTRSCAVPDVLKTKDVVTLDDLMKHNFLRPGDIMEFSGLGNCIETGTLVKDGWIEYGTDKYPDMDAWVARIFKENKKRKKAMDCWETVTARSHPLTYYRDQFLNKMNTRAHYNERKKRQREDKKRRSTTTTTTTTTRGSSSKHAVPGRSRLVQQETQSLQHTTGGGGGGTTSAAEDDEDEEVLIDDEPTTHNNKGPAVVLPHKKRKVSYSKHEPAHNETPVNNSSSSVDLLGEVTPTLMREDTELLPEEEMPKRVSTSTDQNTWIGKRKKDDGKPSSPPQAPSKVETTSLSHLTRRRIETQAQEEFDEEDATIDFDEVGEADKSFIGLEEDKSDKEEDRKDKKDSEAEQDAKEEEKEVEELKEGDASDQTHDSFHETQNLAPLHPTKSEPTHQPLQHIASHHSPTPHQPSAGPSPSTSAANSSSSSSEHASWLEKGGSSVNLAQTPMDSSDMGSFAARLIEHEKDAEELETLTSKKLSQTVPTKQKPPPPSAKTTAAKLSPSQPPKVTSKPIPSIPPVLNSVPTPATEKSSSTTTSTPSKSSPHPPVFSLPPNSSPFTTGSVSPVTTPVTPQTTAPTPVNTSPSIPTTTSTSTPLRNSANRQAVVMTPAKPPSIIPQPALTPSSSISKDGKERIILTTGLRSDMLCTLQALIAQLGGRTVDEFDDTLGQRVTHVVTGLIDESQRAQRTLKYCCGVLCGAWVVSFEWVLASLAAREWVEESDYELRGDTHSAGAPKKARIALRKGTQRLFSGLRFCFAGEFAQPSRKDLQRVARIGGAEILSTLPSPTTTVPEYLTELKHTHIIIDPERTDSAAAHEIHLVCGFVPLSYHWVLDSVSNYSNQSFDKYRIFQQEEGRGYETQQSLEF